MRHRGNIKTACIDASTWLCDPPSSSRRACCGGCALQLMCISTACTCGGILGGLVQAGRPAHRVPAQNAYEAFATMQNSRPGCVGACPACGSQPPARAARRRPHYQRIQLLNATKPPMYSGSYRCRCIFSPRLIEQRQNCQSKFSGGYRCFSMPGTLGAATNVRLVAYNVPGNLVRAGLGAGIAQRQVHPQRSKVL